MSTNCLLKGSSIFKMAIAVAPVTNWRFYDTIYTERYMRTPQENAAGYDDNSPFNYPEKLDKALIRPGRIDINLEVGYCDKPMINEMYKFFYNKDIFKK